MDEGASFLFGDWRFFCCSKRCEARNYMMIEHGEDFTEAGMTGKEGDTRLSNM